MMMPRTSVSPWEKMKAVQKELLEPRTGEVETYVDNWYRLIPGLSNELLLRLVKPATRLDAMQRCVESILCSVELHWYPSSIVPSTWHLLRDHRMADAISLLPPLSTDCDHATVSVQITDAAPYTGFGAPFSIWKHITRLSNSGSQQQKAVLFQLPKEMLGSVLVLIGVPRGENLDVPCEITLLVPVAHDSKKEYTKTYVIFYFF